MAGMRRSEVSVLHWADVVDSTDGDGILVNVRRSKTNQEGEVNDVRFVKDGVARAIRTSHRSPPVTRLPSTLHELAAAEGDDLRPAAHHAESLALLVHVGEASREAAGKLCYDEPRFGSPVF